MAGTMQRLSELYYIPGDDKPPTRPSSCLLSDASICKIATTLRGGNRQLLRTVSGAAGLDLRPYTESSVRAVSHLVNAPSDPM